MSDKVTGVSSSGSFFDARTRRILLPGAKAYSTNSYYLLQKRQLTIVPKDLQIQEINRVRAADYSTWYLYKIQVKQFTARAAKFFLSHSIFLTEKPTKFFPIWPVYIEDPLFIYHNSSSFYFYLCGDDAELRAYPAKSNTLDTHDGKLYKLYTKEREQLISLGKSGALGFSYLIKQPLNKIAKQPKLIIKDATGAELTEDSYTKLPKAITFEFIDSSKKTYKLSMPTDSPKLEIDDNFAKSLCAQLDISTPTHFSIGIAANNMALIIKDYTMTQAIRVFSFYNSDSHISMLQAIDTNLEVVGQHIKHLQVNCKKLQLVDCSVDKIDMQGLFLQDLSILRI